MNQKSLITSSAVIFLSSVGSAQFGSFEQKYFYGFGSARSGRGSLFGGIKSRQFAFQIGLYNEIEIESRDREFVPVDTITLGEYRTSPGFGADFLYFTSPGEQSLYFGVGLYLQSYSIVGRSPSTGLLTNLLTREEVLPAYSVGYWGRTGPHTSIGFGFHSLLGWNLSFGIRR